MTGQQRQKVGIYVHFPWCLKKCPYCDFLSVAVPSADGKPLSARQARERIPHAAYADAVISELQQRYAAWNPENIQIESVFFGGGTPSLWHPDELGRVLVACRQTFAGSWSDKAEVTVECNPTSVDAPHFEALLKAGVNRVSIGVQGLDEERLKFLGRLHDAQGGLEALRTAIAAGVPRVSGDLIFGVAKQDPEVAVEETLRVARTGVTHLSAYSLTIEPNTRFGALDRKGRLPLLEDSLVAESFEAVSAALEKEGFNHYEISNYAKSGQESVHNRGYWKGYDYLGLGTGAFGTVSLEQGRLRYRNLLVPERYMALWNGKPLAAPFAEGLSDREELTAEDAHQEAILLGLRMQEGIDGVEVERLHGGHFFTDERSAAIDELVALGQLQRSGSRLVLPRGEWIFADRAIRQLL